MKNSLYKLYLAIGFILAFSAFLSIALQLATPTLSYYRSSLESYISQELGYPVKIKKLQARWQWFMPAIALNELSVYDQDGHNLLRLDNIMMRIALWHSLASQKLIPNTLIIDGLSLSLRQKTDGSLALDGINGLDSHLTEQSSKAVLNAMSHWLLSQHALMVKHVDARIYLNHCENFKKSAKCLTKEITLFPIHDLSFSMKQDALGHHLKGQFELEQLVSSRVQWIAHLKGDNLSSLDGQIYLHAQDLLFAQWLSKLSLGSVKIDSGQADVKAWANFSHGKLERLQTKLDLSNIALSNTLNKTQLFLKQVKAHLAYESVKSGWRILVDNLRIRYEGQTLAPDDVVITKAGKEYDIYLSYIDLPLLTNFIKLSKNNLSANILAMIDKLKLKGILLSPHIKLKQGQLTQFRAKFSELSTSQYQQFPNLENIKGELRFNQSHTYLLLDSKNFFVGTSSYVPKPLLFPRLKAILEITPYENSYQFCLHDMLINHANLSLKGQGCLQWKNNISQSSLNLDVNYRGIHLENLKPFLPKAYLKPKLYRWLNEALIRVPSLHGSIHTRGLIKAFPFKDDRGEFSIKSYVENMQLAFHRHWPKALIAKGALLATRNKIAALVQKGETMSNPVENIKVLIDDIGGHENLYIKGHFSTDSAKTKPFIQSSPLKKPLAPLLGMRFNGPLALDLNLTIPLYPQNNHNLVKGKLVFTNNDLLTSHLKVKANEINGSVKFNEYGITQGLLKAKVLDTNALIHLKTTGEKEKRTLIKIDGVLKDKALSAYFRQPVDFVKGSAPYQLTIALNEGEKVNILFNSTLKGIQLELPEPLRKTANQSRPLKLEAQLSPFGLAGFHLRFAKQLNIILHPETASSLMGGSQLKAKVDTLSLSGWEPLFSLLANYVNENETSLIKSAHLDIDTLKFRNYQLKHVSLNSKKVDKKWELLFLGPMLEGNLSIYPQKFQVVGHLTKLFVEMLDNQTTIDSQTALKVGQMPNLKLDVTHTHIGDYDLGKVTLDARKKEDAWVVDYFSLSRPPTYLGFKGHWKTLNGQSRTYFKGQLVSKELTQSLQQLKQQPLMESKDVNLLFNLYWYQPLTRLSLSNMNGNLDLKIKRGRITHLSRQTEEKLGLGKLLTILNLQTLPRRLRLDFSDLSKGGLSFDTLDALLNIHQGILKIKKAHMEGPVASMKIEGKVNLKNEILDLVVKVSPHITSSLPVVATIAGGPVAGVATWFANKIITQGMRNNAPYAYKLTGPLDKPSLNQMTH